MTLCPPTRCGCSISSSSLVVQRKAGGVGYNIESYEGVATEVPDTRPVLALRTDGMRVYTWDTKTLWMWDAGLVQWVVLSEFRKSWTLSGVPQGSATAVVATLGGWRQRTHGAWSGKISLQVTDASPITGAGQGGQAIRVSFPYTAASQWEVGGEMMYLRNGVAFYHAIMSAEATTYARFIVDAANNYFGTVPSFTMANGDVMEISMWGSLA